MYFKTLKIKYTRERGFPFEILCPLAVCGKITFNYTFYMFATFRNWMWQHYFVHLLWSNFWLRQPMQKVYKGRFHTKLELVLVRCLITLSVTETWACVQFSSEGTFSRTSPAERYHGEIKEITTRTGHFLPALLHYPANLLRYPGVLVLPHKNTLYPDTCSAT